MLLVLALKAPVVVAFGLTYTWWSVRRSGGEMAVEAAARAAMIGGFAGRLLVGVFLVTVLPLVVSAGGLEFTRDFLLHDANRTALSLFSMGLVALLQSFVLGLSMRLIGPWLPR